MNLLYLFIFIIACYEIVRNTIFFKRDRLDFKSFIFWEVLWIAMLLLALFPPIIDFLMSLLSMSNRQNFLFLISILILFFMSYNFSAGLNKSERQLMRLAQEISIIKYLLEKNQKKEDNKTESSHNSNNPPTLSKKWYIFKPDDYLIP